MMSMTMENLMKVKNNESGEESTIPVTGFFVAIGHAPASELVTDQLETHMGGYVVTKPDSTATSIPGVFAAGDVAAGLQTALRKCTGCNTDAHDSETKGRINL